jgi:hypothetical protein
MLESKGRKLLASLMEMGESWLVVSHGTVSQEMQEKQLRLELNLVVQPSAC